AQDDKVFAVMGTFVDFSGDAQTCISKQQQRPLMTFNLTQPIIDRSPGGMIVTPGYIPERTGQVMITLMDREKMFEGKKVAVLGDTPEATTVNKYIVPALKKAGVPTGSTAILSVGSNGDTGTALSQLESYIERWKTENVNSFLVSGDLASTKQFVIKV